MYLINYKGMDIFDKYDDLRREKEELDSVIEKLCRAYVFDSNFDKATYRLESLMVGKFLIRVPI